MRFNRGEEMELTSSANYWVEQSVLNEDRLDAYYYSKKFIDFDKHISKIGVRTIKVDKIYKVLDGDHGSVEYASDGVVFLRAQNIMDGYIDYENVVYISEIQHKKSKRSMIYKDDILVSIMASTGVSAILNKDILCNANRAVGILRNNNIENVDNHYVSALINSNIGKLIFERGIRGSIQKRLNLTDINDLNIPVPSPDIQNYIGDKVRKAEKLREEAKILKKEAECILSENLNLNILDLSLKKNRNNFDWISSDVLTDRIESDYYKEEFVITIQHLKNSTSKYKVFKNMVEEIYTGKKPLESNIGSEVYFLQSGNISSNFLELNDKVIVDIEKYKKIEDGNLLMAKDGETIGKLAVNYTDKNIILNEHTYCLKFKEQYKNYGAYIYYLFTNPNINALIRREATGSAQKGLSQQFLETIFIPELEEQVINHFKVIEKKRCSCIYQSKSLVEEAKRDIEDLIEGNFDMSKIKETN